MGNVFEKDLLFMFSKGRTTKTLVTKDGGEISGFLDLRFEEALLAGQRSVTSNAGSCFYCLAADADGVEADQVVSVNGKKYLVDDVRDDHHGVAQILFRAEL